MKVSVNWLRQFTGVDLHVDEFIHMIGAQLGAVDEVIDVGAKYRDVVVAVIKEKKEHPDADKLAVYQVDNGSGQLMQVVAGDKSLETGQKVAWIMPGAVVPSTVGRNEFVIEAKELRGQMSNGMLGSGAELAVNDAHDLVLVLDTDAQAGTPFAVAYELDDYVIDIENKMFTHRPDCFGILGVARETAGIQHQQFRSPDWYLSPNPKPQTPNAQKLSLEVKNELPELVPRFMAVAMADVEVRPSTLIIQTYLNRVGLKPINNVVDITNYLMWLTGQPLHAYDADKLVRVQGTESGLQSSEAAELSLGTRMSRKGDKLKLLGGKEVIFDDDSTILITSNDVPVGIGGVIGGADTEVDESTKNIVLECANFDMYSIRKTAMKYGLFTDAVTRFTKGQSPHQNDKVHAKAIEMLMSKSGASIASRVFDQKGPLHENSEVYFSADFINSRLGLALGAEDIAVLLRNIEFDVQVSNGELTVRAPFWRTDIEIPEDVLEEVGRLYGYDKLPLELPKRTISPTKPNELLGLKTKIRDVFSRAGANEVLTYSFVHGDLLEKAGQDKEKAFKLSNALSPDLQYYRLSLTPSLLEKVHPNIKAGHDEFAIFEIGKKHQKGFVDGENLPAESEMLALVIAADSKVAAQKYAGAPYYQAKRYLQELLEGNPEPAFVRLDEENQDNLELAEWMKPFEPARSAIININDEPIGIVGEYRQSVKKALKLPDFCAGFEIGFYHLQKESKDLAYTPLSKYPKVEQDISLRIADTTRAAEIVDFMHETLAEHEHIQEMHYSLVPIDLYQGEDSGQKHLTLRFTVVSYQRTLTDQEVNAILDDISEAASQKFGAQRI